MKKILYSLIILLPLMLCNCAKNVADVVADGRTLGSFEPKNDYVVDIPMGSSLVNGNAKGISILGLITIGASQTSDGVTVQSRGESTLGNAAVYGAGSVMGSLMAFAPESTSQKFKKAALRNACDVNSCDVVGYPMYNVNETNFFLWKTYDVNVKGFPGQVRSLQTVPRDWRTKDSYWRGNNSTPLGSFRTKGDSSNELFTLEEIDSRLKKLNQKIDSLDRSAHVNSVQNKL